MKRYDFIKGMLAAMVLPSLFIPEPPHLDHSGEATTAMVYPLCTMYVDPYKGSDIKGDGSIKKPFATFPKAIDSAQHQTIRIDLRGLDMKWN